MTDQEQFLTLLTALASMVPGFAFNKAALAQYDVEASRIGYTRCSIALKQLMATRSSRDPFPSIAEMVETTIENHMDPEEISVKISGCVSRFGPYRAEEVRTYLGEVGWDIVVMEGGWANVCQMLTYENLAVMQAQWRKLAQAMIRRRQSDRVKTQEFERLGSVVSGLLPDTRT